MEEQKPTDAAKGTAPAANQEGTPATQTPAPKSQPEASDIMIPKHRFDEVVNQRKALEEKVVELEAKLTDKPNPQPEEDWKAKYEALLKENQEKEAAAAAARRRETIMNSIGSEAHDKALVYDLLKLDVITVEGDKVEGLSEQIKELKKTKPFLFKPAAQVAKPAAPAQPVSTSFGKQLAQESAPATTKQSRYFN